MHRRLQPNQPHQPKKPNQPRQHALDEVLSARSEEVAARDSLQAALEIDPPDPAKIKEAQRNLVRAERARMATEALLEKIDAI